MTEYSSQIVDPELPGVPARYFLGMWQWLDKYLPRKDAVVVELNCRAGGWTEPFLRRFHSRINEMYCIEDWNRDRSVPMRIWELNVAAHLGPSQKVHPLLGRTIEWSWRFPLMIDLLFVHGDSPRTTVFVDLAAWVPKVKDGGIVAVHNYDGRSGEVRRAFCQYFRNALPHHRDKFGPGKDVTAWVEFRP